MGLKKLIFLIMNIKKISTPEGIPDESQQAEIPQIEETTNEKESDPK
jgi:hypothetical protein